MKILYALNGTGSGHITRARELIPHLEKKYDVDVLISGCNYIIDTGLDIKYSFLGFTFAINKRGKVSYFKSLLSNNIFRFIFDMIRLDLSEYDLIISDFEPISAWSSKFRKKPSLQLSHQASLYSKLTPRPSKIDYKSEFFIKWYSPCDDYIGFHFHQYDKNILGPLLRDKIINSIPSDEGYYVVYLWNYTSEYIVSILSNISDYQFKIFDSNASKITSIKNCRIQPTGDKSFFESILNCTGVICGAGFELPAEVLYLKKKLYVIPIGNQYEQDCNAEALIQLGVRSYHELDNNEIMNWLKEDKPISSSIKLGTPDQVLHAIKSNIM